MNDALSGSRNTLTSETAAETTPSIESDSLAVTASGLEKTVVARDNRLTILSGLDLQIKSGESVAIVGTSGSGKSTLLGILAGLDLPTAGSVSLAGKRIDHLDEDQRATVRGQHTGFVFQSFQLLANLTALENVMLPLELAGVDNPGERARKLLTRVGLEHRLEHYPKQLSGGEQQRVAIARAFAGEPDILFADEPTGNLDEKTGESIIELLFEVNQASGTTIILVTHDMDLARRCQRILKLHGGRLEAVV
ncbi:MULTISPECIES: ABC transporter ATP-binding protein [unclassified Endozoicomonas]|uniref:ABC transporter ATP-binding protein n=1 Tax=Endozoicomonas TaxID=305899 RepID=UPI0022B36208|nr:ABC transporter ATP-binding protein [Endozoicomonas sp. GU-1]WBA84098.1 ABC transporter ATP-binding protein [Endozoicomonas sp. GU-1]WBA88817.1 ABC transporter ATP-binding protein [Endozoicomonas sp. GU-1]